MEYGGSVVTHTSWLGRAQNSVLGSLVGICLFIGSFALIGWNEDRSVREIRALNECALLVVEGGCQPSPENEGVLVHCSCPLPDIPTFSDADFGATVQTVSLKRVVEMLQWQESSIEKCTKDKVGGGETCVTSYYYGRSWGASPINSNSFHNPTYANPSADQWPVQASSQAPQALHLGGFSLPGPFISALADCDGPACASDVPPLADAALLPICAGSGGACAWRKAQMDGNGYYYYSAAYELGGVGDVRVRLRESTVQSASLVALQQGGSFAPFHATSGHSCFLVEPGEASAAQILSAARARNAAATWLLRLLGLLMMWAGLALVGHPLRLALDLVPFLGPFVGDLLEFGVNAVALVAAGCLSSFTVAVAWMAVRPAVGVPLLLLSLALAAGMVAARRQKQRLRTGGAPYQPRQQEAGGWFRVA